MNRVDEVTKKYPEFVKTACEIKDPSGSNKYLMWMAHQLSDKQTPTDIENAIAAFHKNANRLTERDINKYRDLKSLVEAIEKLGNSKRKEKEKAKDDGAVLIYEDDKCKCYRIDTKEAMILYGANTKWCTVTATETYYEKYIHEGNDFYVVIFKDSAKEKYAILKKNVYNLSIFDQQDNSGRRISESEKPIFCKAISAIINDNAPNHMIREVLSNKNIKKEIICEWFTKQHASTKRYVRNNVSREMALPVTPEEVVVSIGSDYYFCSNGLKTLDHSVLLESVKLMVKLNNDKKLKLANYDTWNYVLELLTEKEIDEIGFDFLINFNNTHTKCTFARKCINPKTLEKLLNDTNTDVVRVVLAKMNTSDLVASYKRTTSKTKKNFISDELKYRVNVKTLLNVISKNTVKDIVVNSRIEDITAKKPKKAKKSKYTY